VTDAPHDVVIDLRSSRDRADRYIDQPWERRRLLDAAVVVLERSRWQGLKVDLVLSEAGLSTRSFYRHFDGKNELLVVLLAEEVTDVVAGAEWRAAHETEPRRQVEAWVEAITELSRNPLTAERAHFFVSMGGLLERDLPSEVAQVRMIMIASLAEIIEQGIEDGRFDSPDPVRDASAIHCLMVGAMLASEDTGVPSTPVEAARFAVRALTGPTGPVR
jgi:AcrR family transcriptional regulator